MRVTAARAGMPVIVTNDFSVTYNTGADEIRTHDLLHAMQALSQLSYGPDQEGTI